MERFYRVAFDTKHGELRHWVIDEVAQNAKQAKEQARAKWTQWFKPHMFHLEAHPYDGQTVDWFIRTTAFWYWDGPTSYKVYKVQGDDHVHLFSTSEGQQAVSGAKEAALMDDVDVYVTQVKYGCQKTNVYHPDGSVTKLWEVDNENNI